MTVRGTGPSARRSGVLPAAMGQAPERPLAATFVGAAKRAMEFQDKTLQCVDCGSGVHLDRRRAGLFRRQGSSRTSQSAARPARPSARPRRRAPGAPRERVETVAVCAVCGKETTVPFKPTQGRPVLCRECFQQRKAARGVRLVSDIAADAAHVDALGFFVLVPAAVGVGRGRRGVGPAVVPCGRLRARRSVRVPHRQEYRECRSKNGSSTTSRSWISRAR